MLPFKSEIGSFLFLCFCEIFIVSLLPYGLKQDFIDFSVHLVRVVTDGYVGDSFIFNMLSLYNML